MLKKKDVSKRGETLPAETDPKKGLEEGYDRDDLIIPRAKVIQPTSDEAGDFKPGTIINSLTLEEIPLVFIPILFFKQWIRYNARNASDVGYDSNYELGAEMWRTRDPLDPRVGKEGKWGPNNEPPLATAFLNFISYFPGVNMPLVISFAKTSYKAGKMLLSTIKFCKGPAFGRKYKLSASMIENTKGKFAVLKAENIGPVSDEELLLGERMWKEYSRRTQDIQVHDENDETAEKSQDGTEKPGFGGGNDIPF